MLVTLGGRGGGNEELEESTGIGGGGGVPLQVFALEVGGIKTKSSYDDPEW